MFGSPQRPPPLKPFLFQSCVCDLCGLFQIVSDFGQLVWTTGVHRVCLHAPLLWFRNTSLCYIFYVWTRASVKNADILCHTRTAWQRVGGNLCLFVWLCYHLLFPVKTGKDRGENGGVGKCCLDVCWLEVQLWLMVTLPARKNRSGLGVTHSGILHCVIFITFTKCGRGMPIPVVDTGLGNFCL